MRVHFIAIGGAVMHQLAIDLHLQGHQVTGSDDEIFDPARSNLERYGLLPDKVGWKPDRISPEIDAVILGMHAHADNPELKKAQQLNLALYSFPEFVYEQTKDATRVSISGSHGKTTTTAMVMHVLADEGIDFDYLVGSKLDNFERSVSLHGAPILIAEGDEYLASSLKPIPKFLFLKPQIAVLTGIAWDHINVFPTYENYFSQFVKFLQSMPEEAQLIYNEEDPEVVRCVEQAGAQLRCTPYTTPSYKISKGKTYLEHSGKEYPLEVFGRHNLSNMAAACEVCTALGVAQEQFYQSISGFRGTAKRMEKVAENDQGFVFRDFAHAPSKVKASLSAAREQFEEFHLVACLELHTYSSLNVEFMQDYAHSLDMADEALVFYSEHALELKRLPDIAPDEVQKIFATPGLEVFTERKQLEKKLASIDQRPIVYLMMSSGNYDGMDMEFVRGLIDTQ